MPRSPKPQTEKVAEDVVLHATDGAAQLLRIPRGHIGPVALHGSGRLVWWTGRVAIGLRHESRRDFGPISQSGLWIQRLLLRANSDTPVTA